MKERIIKIMEREGLTPSRFAEEIGIQRSAMSHIISGRNNPSLDVLTKIIERYSYVDTDWLIFGKGNMVKGQIAEPDLFSNLEPINPTEKTVSTEYRKEIPVNSSVNSYQQPVRELVVEVEKPSRKVTKIMVFYSDNQFDTFIPEKKE